MSFRWILPIIFLDTAGFTQPAMAVERSNSLLLKCHSPTDGMKRKLLGGLTAALLTTTLTTATSGQAEQSPVVAKDSTVGLATAEMSHDARGAKLQGDSDSTLATSSPTNGALQSIEAVKVGEYQSQSSTRSREEVIAKLQSHNLAGRQATTLYVRDIPVLTFLGSGTSTPGKTKIGETEPSQAVPLSAQTKTISSQDTESAATSAQSGNEPSSGPSNTLTENNSLGDSMRRATAVAARLNQLQREGVDAGTITVSWQSTAGASGSRRERYIIKVGEEELVEMNSDIILPDTTRNPARDALQATNRLRRLMGKASPLREISGYPKQTTSYKVAAASRFVRQLGGGMASWYGPGFHGNRSASGEIFNQNALTAAHRRLPFGTRVKVTNLNNGRSVVVRINDRGPFIHGRVIDVSVAAARVLGMMGSGVAPVRLDIVE